jgi:hypothetical protein
MWTQQSRIMKASFLGLCLSVFVLGACASDEEIACGKVEQCLPDQYASRYDDIGDCEEDYRTVDDLPECASCLDDASCVDVITAEACEAACAS